MKIENCNFQNNKPCISMNFYCNNSRSARQSLYEKTATSKLNLVLF